jgi:tRNA nucleotidyltransferase (CCA-adding enzyme)
MTSQSVFTKTMQAIQPIVTSLNSAGGRAFLVGGAVRDLVLNRTIKDIDIEVHGLPLEKVQTVLSMHGPVALVGKKFGVLRVGSHDVDWSLPRTDSSGRKPEVNINPHLGITEACKRRDVRMNAMALEVTEKLDLKNIIDPFGGQEDLKQKRIGLIDAQLFVEDPLRFYRVMQFISRFELTPDDELNTVAFTMNLCDPETHVPIAAERIWQEVWKLLTKSTRPSLGLRWLKKINRLAEVFPELAALVGVAQRADYHPEGDVFEHTMQAIDAAAALLRTEEPSLTEPTMPTDDQKYGILMLGILCHDLGKPMVSTPDGKAHQHELAGLAPANTFLKRLTNEHEVINTVQKIVRYHLMPGSLLAQKSSSAAYKRLAHKLAPELNFYELCLVAYADNAGRNGAGPVPLTTKKELFCQMLAPASHTSVVFSPEVPLLMGKDFLDHTAAGPEIGKLVKRAYELQIAESITDKDLLKKKVLAE